jgi:adenine C2-methylase RlmN of 23S rRNA A2503 and tRNA A37
MPESIYGATLAGLGNVAAEAGLPAYGARQLCDWLYGKNATSFSLMRNIPLRAREWLA